MEKGIRLLFIDDEKIVLNSCLKILSKKDYEIDVARSGEEGLNLIRGKNYDIVVTDLKMPGIGGMELLKILREEYPDMTVIIFTAFATVDTARVALKMGAFDYIPKPFKPQELRKVIENAVKAREEESRSGMLDLMQIVSHELKSPVSSVYTNAEILYKGYFGKLAPEQIKTIESILRNCEYLEDIIRNYIDVSRIGMNDLECFMKEIDIIEDVIKPVLSSPECSSIIKDIRITYKIHGPAVTKGDPALLQILVNNMINNAAKYKHKASKIIIQLTGDNDNYIFSIYNEGVGINREDIENRLFKKFSRLKQEGTEGIKGSGLGLYICRKIIEKHNGRIWAESETGKWVKFFFSLHK